MDSKLYYKPWNESIFITVLNYPDTFIGFKVRLKDGIYEEWGIITSIENGIIKIDCMPFYGFSQFRRITKNNYIRVCFIR